MLYRVDPAGKATALGIQTRGSAAPRDLTFSSNGKLMAYIAYWAGVCLTYDELAIADLSTGQTTMLTMPKSHRRWGVSDVWFDDHNTLYATLAPYPARCDPSSNGQVTPKSSELRASG